MKSSLNDSVASLLAGAARDLVLPRYRCLGAAEVMEKSPGEIVTVVDRAVEAFLIPELLALRPGSRVVGEEGVSDDPTLLDHLDRGEVWLVDPIDGTTNFVHGRDAFGIMVALMRDGEVLMSWIQFPVTGSIAIAERGAGAWLNGRRLQLPARCAERAYHLQGMVKTGFMPEPMRSAIEERTQRHLQDRVAGVQSAAGDYVAAASGAPDFSLYWRMLPWDHAPGTLLVTEAGGHVARQDGRPYRGSDNGNGLLVARSREVWETAHGLLLTG